MVKLLLLMMVIVAGPAYAGDGVDVKEWLSRPGVKLLVVEFYASWCSPCKKAVPQWKQLHEKYRDHGLRLVVVSVQDPDGSCVNPGWNPDDVVCDSEGRLAEAWGVGDRLPASFLWSWRGTLLVRKGSHVDEVERAVAKELGRLPRVILDDGVATELREPLRMELARTGKVDVVADGEEDKSLAEIRRKSHALQFSDRSVCRLGEQIAANSLLKASFVKAGNGMRLLVQLFSAETGCLSASAGVFWNERKPELSVAEAVTELVNSLRVDVELPGGSAQPVMKEREIEEQSQGWELQADSEVVVGFQTNPEGAVVLLDGRVLCQSTPCSKLVAPGTHKIEFQLESYLPIRESVRLTKETGSVDRTLVPDFGWLTVRSVPSELPVMLDDKPWGTTPVIERTVSLGPHRVMVQDPRYFGKGKEVLIERGEHEHIQVEVVPRQGGIEVKARGSRGNDLVASVQVDGVPVGSTPFQGKVIVGDHRITVTQDGSSWERTVTVKEQELESLEAILDVEFGRPEGPTESGSEPEPLEPRTEPVLRPRPGAMTGEGEIKFAILASDGSLLVEELQKLDSSVRKATHGTIGFKFYVGGIMGDEGEVVEKLKSGQLHGAALTGVGLGSIAPAIRVMDIPFTFTTSQEYDYVLRKLSKWFKKQFSDEGFEILAWGDMGFAYLLSKKKLSSVSALRATKPWAWDLDAVAMAAFNAVGVLPITLSPERVAEAFDTGIIDTVYGAPAATIAFSWHRKVKYIADLPFSSSSGALVVTQAFWDSLPDGHKETIKLAATETMSSFRKKTRRENEKALQTLKAKGIEVITLTPANIKAFQAAGAKAADTLVGTLYSAKLLAKVRALLGTLRSH